MGRPDGGNRGQFQGNQKKAVAPIEISLIFTRILPIFDYAVIGLPSRLTLEITRMVDYFELPELPGRQMFRCERRSATLQAQNCASMWRQANDRGAPERLDICKNCPLGASHAGVNEISLSPLRGASVCARCHQGTTRLIRGHLCVSCANRFYERLKGKNAKGKF